MKFEEFKLKQEILTAVKRAGFTEATPIQEKCIPPALEGRDIVGQSSTGSGKTAAFGLPLIEKVERGKGLQALILTPTRELCVQVKEKIEEFSLNLGLKVSAVYGGVGITPQIHELKTHEVVVATPGRMLDHIDRRTINLRGIKVLVLDEADKMFEMGFIEDVRDIIKMTPKERQTMLFSATISPNIKDLISSYLNNPLFVRERLHIEKHLLKQVYYNVRQNDKFSLLLHLLKHKTEGLAIVFCGTRREVDAVSRNLKKNKIKVLAVHGGLSQNKRTNAVELLRNEGIQVLVATDVAARGLDIQNISHIYNYDSPKTSEEYTHRVGRTARAGKSGEAITLLSDRDHDNFRNVLSDKSILIEIKTPPEFEKIRFERGEERSFSGRQGFRGTQRSNERRPRNNSRGSGSFSARTGERPTTGPRRTTDSRRSPNPRGQSFRQKQR